MNDNDNDNTLKLFIIVTPGLEKLAQKELVEKWNIHFNSTPLPELKIITGGILGEFPATIGLSLNALLKIPTRILLRIAEFTCRDFPKLYKNVHKINWNDYLLAQVPQLKTSTHKSRLMNTSKMDATISQAIQDYFVKQAPSKKQILLGEKQASAAIYTRVDNDHCTISIDLSGERLQKRGHRINIGEAPLRENLAAALVYRLKNTDRILIDPMCGSGTLLIEAHDFYRPIMKDFPFLFFKTFKNFTWPKLHNPYPNGLFREYIGMDLNPLMIEAALENCQNASLPDIQCAQIDLFTKNNLHHYNDPVIISNPPYGIRLHKHENTQNLLTKIAQQIIQKFSPHDIGLLLPSKNGINLPAPFQVKETFRNGGLNVKFWSYLP